MLIHMFLSRNRVADVYWSYRSRQQSGRELSKLLVRTRRDMTLQPKVAQVREEFWRYTAHARSGVVKRAKSSELPAPRSGG